jgi:signal transduction histidine kinase/DNA-binding response OmpR family regulator
MVPHHIHLCAFVEPVPVCPETASLAMALQCASGCATPDRLLNDRLLNDRVNNLASFSDRLVLLNEQQQPTGVVRMASLLPHTATLNFSSQLPQVTETVLGDLPAIVEPIVLLAAELSIADFLPQFTQTRSHYGLIDQTGKFLGLLDPVRLLKVLLSEVSEPKPDDRKLDDRKLDDRKLDDRKLEAQRMAQLTDWWQAARSPTSATPTSLMSRLTALQPLLNLLEQLPLPLMLQTGNGRVLAQNAVWREQVGGWRDPAWVEREASVLLATSTVSVSMAAAVARSPLPSEAHLGTIVPEELTLELCQLGATPDICVCACPLKSGQEQILEFIKIPLSPSAQTDSTNSIAQPQTHSAQRFQLATLLPDSHAGTSINQHGLDQQSGAIDLDAPSESLWLILAQDITEQQQLARELAAKNADLVQLNRLKDEFLACISHELRTPLTAILGLSSLLKDQTLGVLNQRQTHYAQLIYQSGRHLMTVVNDILDLTRMETGQMELVLEPVNILKVCQRAFEQATQLRSPNEAATPTALPDFSLQIEPELEFLIADEMRLRQILMHLLSNALKFTDRQQKIGLKVGHWGGWIAFTVWDTGIGIPADKQHLIFQKFQQLENPLTRQFDGTGLGLVLTQRLARLHGGDVTFLSKVGQGSQFTVLLPPSPPPKTQLVPEAIAADSASYPGAEGRRSSPAKAIDDRLVLVVEAVPHFIETLSEQLTGLGYRVAIARSGTEAVEKARCLQPCLILLNPVLPQLSGWDVLTLLKANGETQQIAVVVMATQIDQTQVKRHHADGWLSLPVQTKALQESLLQLVRQSPKELPDRPSPRLTILRLTPDHVATDSALTDSALTDSAPTDLALLDINAQLHSQHYRVLESDDLEQAELLSRVWQPSLVLLDGAPAQRSDYFQRYSQQPFLASLPLVTLDWATTQLANQAGLLVFPCLVDQEPSVTANLGEPSALLQAIQVAAGYGCRSTILMVDVAVLPESSNAAEAEACDVADCLKEAEWQQALTQYLQTAGLRSVVARSWQGVLQQLDTQSVDLILLGWTETEPRSTTLQRLAQLAILPAKPPILVLDHRSYNPMNDASAASVAQIPDRLRQLAAQVLPPSLPMTDLLQQIRTILNH